MLRVVVGRKLGGKRGERTLEITSKRVRRGSGRSSGGGRGRVVFEAIELIILKERAVLLESVELRMHEIGKMIEITFDGSVERIHLLVLLEKIGEGRQTDVVAFLERRKIGSVHGRVEDAVKVEERIVLKGWELGRNGRILTE